MSAENSTEATTEVKITSTLSHAMTSDNSNTPLTPQAVSIPNKAGALPAHVFLPESENHLPALLLLHDQEGIDEWTLAVGHTLAEQGFTVVIPDLFANAKPPQDGDAVARADFLLGLSDSKIVGDLLSATSWLATQEVIDPNRLGIVGWGWSGAHALMAASHDNRLRAVADIGGTITYPVLTANHPGSPLNFIADLEGALFAAFPGADPLLPAMEIERLRGRLIDHDKVGEIKVYADAPPRFWRDTNSPATALLWRRLTNFLTDQLAEDAEDIEFVDAGVANEASRLHA